MDFPTVLQTRRSVRSFAKQNIPEPVLRRILEAARIAPSACNNQPWRFIVVQDPAVITQLADLSAHQTFFAAAPVVIVCCGKCYDNPYNWIGQNLFLVDLAVSIDHLQLAARNEGIGACWIGAFDHDPIKSLLAIPADHDVVMLVPLGYPAAPDAFHPNADRLKFSEIFYSERFGQPANFAPSPPNG